MVPQVTPVIGIVAVRDVVQSIEEPVTPFKENETSLSAFSFIVRVC